MTETVLKILKELGIEEYNIYDEIRESVELFFVKRKLDLSRKKKVQEIRLRVYRTFDINGESYKGSSDVFIYPGMNESIIKKLAEEAYESARHVKNPVFELCACEKGEEYEAEMDLMESSLAMAEGLFSAKEDESAFINSAEIFSNKKTVRILTSMGTDVGFSKYNVQGEFVVQCKTAQGDVELYRDFDYDFPDVKALKEKCEDALIMVKDRVIAKKAPEDLSTYDIVLTDSNVGELISFYMARCNAAYVYPGYSPYHDGYEIQKDSVGEKINLTGIPKQPFSDEGVRMQETPIIENGIVKNIHGANAFLYYLGAKQLGTFSNYRLNNGTKSYEQLIEGKCIVVKNFSDFQIDAFDGHFGGEFRLAYLYENGVKTPITAGTVTGNLFKSQGTLVFSKEKYTDGNYSGPKAVRIG